MRLEAHRNVLSLPFGYLGTELRGQCEGKRKPKQKYLYQVSPAVLLGVA